MRSFELKIDLAAGGVLHQSGFEDDVYRESTSRLAVQSKISKGQRDFYIEGNFYSFKTIADLHRWLETFDLESISQWARGADGDFRLLVLDKAGNKAYLLSDRNGGVRTYYAIERGTLSISSSRLGLIRLMESPRLSSFAAYQMMTLYVVDPNSLIEGANATMPGQVITCDKSGASAEQYYSPVAMDCEYLETEADCVAAMDTAYRKVFQKRLSGERVPCVLLSGGIDSLTMLKYVKEFYSGRVVTLTFAFKNAYPNELEPARIAAQHLGTEHHELIIDPEDALGLYIRALTEADTAHPASLTCFAERQYLEREGSEFDIFSGEDTRLHTPNFDFPIGIGISLNRNPAEGAGRRALASMVAKMLRMYPRNGSLRNYLRLCADRVTPRTDFRAYVIEALTAFHVPGGNGLHNSTYFTRLLDELPEFGTQDGLQEIFKKYISFEYRAQYTDDMNCGMSVWTGPATEAHYPFYDWESVMASNRVAYRVGMQPLVTLRSWTKLPFVYKRVARGVVADVMPKEVLFRAKKTCPFQHLIFSTRMGGVVRRMLEKWSGPLLDSLHPEAREIAQAYVSEYRSKRTFVRNHDEALLWAVLAISYLAILNQACANRSFQVLDEMQELQDETRDQGHQRIAVSALP